MRTSFHHQPEAQHPKSSAINNNAGRLPHLLALFCHLGMSAFRSMLGVKRKSRGHRQMVENDPIPTLGLASYFHNDFASASEIAALVRGSKDADLSIRKFRDAWHDEAVYSER